MYPQFRCRLCRCPVGPCLVLCPEPTGQEVNEPPDGTAVPRMWPTSGGVALEATANDTENNKPRPTVNSRMLALPMVAQFDAWSRYDSLAVPVFLKAERRPVAEHTRPTRRGVSYAMARR